MGVRLVEARLPFVDGGLGAILDENKNKLFVGTKED